MDRRNFLKFTSAALLASQLPGNTAAASTNPHGEYWNSYQVGEQQLAATQGFGVVLRRVLLVQEGSIAEAPPVGTVLLSSDDKHLFTVVHPSGVGEVIPYVTGRWDEQTHGKERYLECGGVVVMVQAVAPGNSCADCNIRKVVTPTLKYDHVCEAYNTRCYFLGGSLAFFAYDAVYPPEAQPS